MDPFRLQGVLLARSTQTVFRILTRRQQVDRRARPCILNALAATAGLSVLHVLSANTNLITATLFARPARTNPKTHTTLRGPPHSRNAPSNARKVWSRLT